MNFDINICCAILSNFLLIFQNGDISIFKIVYIILHCCIIIKIIINIKINDIYHAKMSQNSKL